MKARAASVALALLVCAGAGVVGVVGASVARDAPAEVFRFKYYEVAASDAGKPESLSEIALRFLGSSGRSNEIFDLNFGRGQPDGGSLTDPNSLRAGWLLILPWDAVGDGVHLGTLPTNPPAKPAATAAPVDSAPAGPVYPATAGPVYPATAGPVYPATAGPVASSGPGAPASPTSQPSGSCATAAAQGIGSSWAALRMAAEQAWTRSRGKGVTVAVVDSGVDASVPQLASQVSEGADIVSGSGRGNTDCLGSGTAMASIIVAHPGQGNTLSGIAPDSVVLPIRVVTTSPKARPDDQISAIEVAVSTGATVLALGSYIDTDDPKVAAAIANAVMHNAVVVVPAPTGTGAPAGKATPGVLRVGGVGVDNRPAEQYRPGEVDVVAPGVDVNSLGITGTGVSTGTGTHFAVAYVAGEVALVRAAHPDLTPAQVVHRVQVTADKQGEVVPDSTYGWGIINPGAAVQAVLAEDSAGVAALLPPTPPPGGGQSSSGQIVAVVIVVLVGLVAAAAVALRLRSVVRAGSGGGGRQAVHTGYQDPDTRDLGPADEIWTGEGREEESGSTYGPADAAGAETARPLPSRWP